MTKTEPTKDKAMKFVDNYDKLRYTFKKLRQEFPLIHVGDELPFYCMNLIFYCKYVIISI